MGILFYVIMLIWFLFGLYWNWPADGGQGRVAGFVGGNLMLFILLLLLGWRVFGPPLQ